MDSVTAYLVPDWVRVRQEDFGLLFYDSRSTRLKFVRSGDRLVPPPFTGERRELWFAGATGPAVGGAPTRGVGRAATPRPISAAELTGWGCKAADDVERERVIALLAG